ncbi:MAG: 1-deoxy-D-xylulose-5-phosphate synthase, partial [Oscillospiraceae bacterium]|nr:1-deoxy-D-xylulose-5-phosphate synthase [Oscillospiraceae bacterium]
ADSRVTAITAAMSCGTGLDRFAARFPDRFEDVGIAEGHATSMAAGMAKQGAIPVFAVYASFLQRGYDMLIHDVALQKLHVVLGVDRAGIVGGDGETHHGIFDVSFLRSVPGMTIFCPASYAELREMLRTALFESDGPVAIRYPRGGEGNYTACSEGPEQRIRTGSDVTIVSYGLLINEALSAADSLEDKGLSADVIKINRIAGDVYPLVMDSLKKTGRLVMAEEVCAADCLGTSILAQAEIQDVCLKKAALLNLGDGILPHGDRQLLLRDRYLDAQAIAEAAIALP